MKTLLAAGLAALSFSAVSAPASATILIEQSPSFVQPDENLQFNEIGVDYTDLNPLFGWTNKGTRVTLVGEENLSAEGSGQARVSGADGSFDYLEYFLSDAPGFLETEFNINISNRTTATTATVTFYDNEGTMFSTLVNLGNGSNWVGARAIDGQFIARVTIDANGTLADVRQIRLGGVIPEPATWAMLIAGFGLVGVAMRRRTATVRTIA